MWQYNQSAIRCSTVVLEALVSGSTPPPWLIGLTDGFARSPPESSPWIKLLWRRCEPWGHKTLSRLPRILIFLLCLLATHKFKLGWHILNSYSATKWAPNDFDFERALMLTSILERWRWSRSSIFDSDGLKRRVVGREERRGWTTHCWLIVRGRS